MPEYLHQTGQNIVPKNHQVHAQNGKFESLKQIIVSKNQRIKDMEAQKSSVLWLKDLQISAQNDMIESMQQIIVSKDKQIETLKAQKSNNLAEFEPSQAIATPNEDDDYEFVDQVELQQFEVISTPLAGPGANNVQGACEDVTLFATEPSMSEPTIPTKKAAASVPAPAASVPMTAPAKARATKRKVRQSKMPTTESGNTIASAATPAYKGMGKSKHSS